MSLISPRWQESETQMTAGNALKLPEHISLCDRAVLHLSPGLRIASGALSLGPLLLDGRASLVIVLASNQKVEYDPSPPFPGNSSLESNLLFFQNRIRQKLYFQYRTTRHSFHIRLQVHWKNSGTASEYTPVRIVPLL